MKKFRILGASIVVVSAVARDGEKNAARDGEKNADSSFDFMNVVNVNLGKMQKSAGEMYATYMPMVNKNMALATAATREAGSFVSEYVTVAQEMGSRVYGDEKLHDDIKQMVGETYETGKMRFDDWKSYGMVKSGEALKIGQDYYVSAYSSMSQFYEQNIPEAQKQIVSNMSEKAFKQYTEIADAVEILRVKHNVPRLPEMYAAVYTSVIVYVNEVMVFCKAGTQQALEKFEQQVKPRFQEAKETTLEKTGEIYSMFTDFKAQNLSKEAMKMRGEYYQMLLNEYAMKAYFWSMLKFVEISAHPTTRSALTNGSEAWEMIKTHADKGVAMIEEQMPNAPVRKYLNYDNVKLVTYWWFMLYVVAYLLVFRVAMRKVIPSTVRLSCKTVSALYSIAYTSVKAIVVAFMGLLKMTIQTLLFVVIKVPFKIVFFVTKLALWIVSLPFLVILAVLRTVFCCCRSRKAAAPVSGAKSQRGGKVAITVEMKNNKAIAAETTAPAQSVATSAKPVVEKKNNSTKQQQLAKANANAKKGKKTNP